jgi:hypothetical protein
VWRVCVGHIARQHFEPFAAEQQAVFPRPIFVLRFRTFDPEKPRNFGSSWQESLP